MALWQTQQGIEHETSQNITNFVCNTLRNGEVMVFILKSKSEGNYGEEDLKQVRINNGISKGL